MGVIHNERTIRNEHPGYDVIKGLDDWFYPVRLPGGATLSPNQLQSDAKGRHLDNEQPRRFGYDTEREVFVFLGNGGHDDIISFDNEPHAHNFLNKWVREEIGLDKARQVWEAYNWGKDSAKPADSIKAITQEYTRLRATYNILLNLIEQWERGPERRKLALESLECMIDLAPEETKQLFVNTRNRLLNIA